MEEVLTVLAGRAEVWIEAESTALTSGQLVVVPAGHRHGFRNIEQTTLHMEAILAAPMFEAATEDLTETRQHWHPGAL